MEITEDLFETCLAHVFTYGMGGIKCTFAPIISSCATAKNSHINEYTNPPL